MTWCDKLASTPTVGLRLDWHYASGNMLLESLSPLLVHMNSGDAPAFGIDSIDHNSVIFTTNEGFQYAANANRISVGFASRARIKQVGGGRHSVEILSESKPYSVLLPIACDKLIEAALMLPNGLNRVFTRVGVVSKTIVDEPEYPPGITKLVDYFARPWAVELDAYNINVTAKLKTDRGWHDRCIHTVTKFEDTENAPTLNFDWQRTFTASRPLNAKTLREEIGAARKAALEYFEQLGDGSMFDDDIVSISGEDGT